jgi:hypothetical protein
MSGDRLTLSTPQGTDPKGISALEHAAEDASAKAYQLADLKAHVKALEKGNADIEKLIAKAEQKPPANASKKTAPGKSSHVAHAQGWKAICTEPDLCKVGKDIIAFDSFATLDKHHKASPDVKARGTHVYRKGDMIKGVQADAGKHIESGTSQGSGHVKILDGHNNVKVNNIPIAKHDGNCLINCDASGKGGAKGKLVTEQKSITASASNAGNPQAPPGQRTSEKLARLKQAKAKLEAGQLDFNALDDYVNFKESNAGFDGFIGKIQGTPGSASDYAAQATRGVLGFVKDGVMGIGEMAYEGIKAVPKIGRSLYTSSGQAISQLDAQIFAENIQLGNITPGTIGQGALDIGKAMVKPVTDPWKKGQYVEAGTRAVTEVGTLAFGWIKGSKAAQAAKAADALKAEQAAEAAKVAAAADAAKAEELAAAAKADAAADGVHVASRTTKLRELLENKWGKGEVESALKEKRSDPKLDALLSDDEYLSIRAYTSNLYTDINPALRSGAPGEWSQLVEEASNGMEKMAKNGYDFDGMVRRDVTFSTQDIERLFKNSGEFSDPAFLSTSTKLDGVFTGNTTILVEGRSGIQINALSEYATEAEVLFKPGTQFRVIKVIDGTVGSNTKIYLEEILK